MFQTTNITINHYKSIIDHHHPTINHYKTLQITINHYKMFQSPPTSEDPTTATSYPTHLVLKARALGKDGAATVAA